MEKANNPVFEKVRVSVAALRVLHGKDAQVFVYLNEMHVAAESDKSVVYGRLDGVALEWIFAGSVRGIEFDYVAVGVQPGEGEQLSFILERSTFRVKACMKAPFDGAKPFRGVRPMKELLELQP